MGESSSNDGSGIIGISSSSSSRSRKRRPLSIVDFYDDVLEKIFGYIKRPVDRNSISAVCKRFHEVEARCRQHVLVYNMYAVSPDMLFNRFPSVTSITMKGNPRIVDFDILPKDWAGHAGPWIDAIKAHPQQLNRFRIKRMKITDWQIEELCAACGPTLRTLIFDKCEGFTGKGLESLSRHCKNLTTLGMAQCECLSDGDTTWLRLLVDHCQQLETLDLSLVEIIDVEDNVLIALARRCKVLKLWESQDPDRLQIVLRNCSSNLTDLGILRFTDGSRCTGLEGLSGIFDLVDGGMEAFLSVSSRLKRLDLSYSNFTQEEIADFLTACPNLEQLRMLNLVGDHGLRSLGLSCRNLSRLVVESSSESDVELVKHIGLIAVARGCPNLQKLIVYPSLITNEALQTLAYNCPLLTDVRINLMRSNDNGNQEWEPNLDAGVCALVQRCRNLYRLTLSFDVKTRSTLLTDIGMAYIGRYASKLRVLTLVNCGSSDKGLEDLLEGCNKLQRLEMRKCPFGDESMFEIACNKQLHLKYLFMQGCNLTADGFGLNALASRSKFYVEVIGCRNRGCHLTHHVDDQESHLVSLTCSHWQVLAYHSLTEPRSDRPWFIQHLKTSLADTLEEYRAEVQEQEQAEKGNEEEEQEEEEEELVDEDEGVGVEPEDDDEEDAEAEQQMEDEEMHWEQQQEMEEQNQDRETGIDLNEPPSGRLEEEQSAATTTTAAAATSAAAAAAAVPELHSGGAVRPFAWEDCRFRSAPCGLSAHV